MDTAQKLVLTLSGDAAQATRKLAAQMDVVPPEAVRRGLSMLQLLLSLKGTEELVIRDKKDGSLERVRFQWDFTMPAGSRTAHGAEA